MYLRKIVCISKVIQTVIVELIVDALDYLDQN